MKDYLYIMLSAGVLSGVAGIGVFGSICIGVLIAAIHAHGRYEGK